MDEVRGFQHVFGRDYSVPIDSSLGDSEPIAVWTRYRQDNAGLYVARIPFWTPPSGTVFPTLPAAFHAPFPSAFDVPPSALPAHVRNTRGQAMMLAAIQRANSRLNEMPVAFPWMGQLKSGPTIRGQLADEVALLRYPLHLGQTWVYDPLAKETLT